MELRMTRQFLEEARKDPAGVSAHVKRLLGRFDFGVGGHRGNDFRCHVPIGADEATETSAAVRYQTLIDRIAGAVGAHCLVLAIDARGGEVYVRGGREATGKDAITWAKEVADRGAGEILLTSMDRDGTRLGYDLELTRRVAEAVSVPVIASGGVGNLEHLQAGLQEGGADAVLAASIFHFGEHSVREARAYLAARGIPVRPVAQGLVP